MNSPNQALDTLLAASADGRLEAICVRFGIDVVTVFGSALDPSVAEPGDLDVAVRFGESTEADVIGAYGALSDLVESDSLDLMILNNASVVARSRALGPGGRGLYESRRGLYALAQMAALTEEMETAPMRRRDLELLANR